MLFGKRLLAAALGAGLLLVFCGAALAQDVIKIAVAAPLTGAVAGYGENVKAGAAMKIEEINPNMLMMSPNLWLTVSMWIVKSLRSGLPVSRIFSSFMTASGTKTTRPSEFFS